MAQYNTVDENFTVDAQKFDYLKLLSKTYRNIQEASTEVINLEAILNMPKGTEHFVSDIHGEYASLNHILRNASGVIKTKIDETFGGYVSPEERSTLATLVYYPEEKLELIKKNENSMSSFYSKTLHRLITLLSVITVKYTRSYVREQIPKEYSYIIEELLFGDTVAQAKGEYKDKIIATIIDLGVADDFIIKMCDLIARVSVYHLHVIGDLFDRGPGADKVLDILNDYHSVDIQWGNHDINWMGAACGNKACIANVVRLCTRYDNLHTLEIGYGISLRPLLTFAQMVYADDPCDGFKPFISREDAMSSSDYEALSKICKAIIIIQFKLEGQMIASHPHYEMDSMRHLHNIDFEKGTVKVDNVEYKMTSCNFPTVDPEDPYRLTPEEDAVMERLKEAFLESRSLQDHISFLFAKGSLYKTCNGNLLFHGCMPLNNNGTFMPIMTSEGPKKGKEWFDYAEQVVRRGYAASRHGALEDGNRDIDFFWYLWCGYKSPLFGKKKMTTFERIFITDESTWIEEKNPYYELMDQVKVVEDILEEFGLDRRTGHIINGHMPVKAGQNPVHANGRAFVIDGGFAKAYQKTTGIAGYSLLLNSQGFQLAAHEPFVSKETAVQDEEDIHSETVAKEGVVDRIYNRDTDEGKEMRKRINDLKLLLKAYRAGMITQEVVK